MIYMIIGLFVFTIGIIPLVLALTVIRNNKDSKLSLGLFLFMIVITIWQADVGILYFKDQLSEEIDSISFSVISYSSNICCSSCILYSLYNPQRLFNGEIREKGF